MNAQQLEAALTKEGLQELFNARPEAVERLLEAVLGFEEPEQDVEDGERWDGME